MSTDSSSSDEFSIKYGSPHPKDSFWQPRFLDDGNFENDSGGKKTTSAEADFISFPGETIGDEYKEEWRRYLAKKNYQQISKYCAIERRTFRFSFYKKIIVNKIFHICKVLNQPPEVRYLAVDILDRFMEKYIFDVAETVEKNEQWTERVWNMVTERMVNQSFIRVLSSIQLASKYSANFRALTTGEMHRFLKTAGRNFGFSKQELLKSEARLFQTLEFKIPTITPLSYIEMFFEDFRYEDMTKHLHMTLSSFLNVCIDVLDVATVFHREIYHSFFTIITGRPCSLVMDAKFLSVEADYMYLSMCVILTAAVIQDPTHVVSEMLLKFFTDKTQYKRDEIESLTKVILDIALNH